MSKSTYKRTNERKFNPKMQQHAGAVSQYIGNRPIYGKEMQDLDNDFVSEKMSARIFVTRSRSSFPGQAVAILEQNFQVS